MRKLFLSAFFALTMFVSPVHSAIIDFQAEASNGEFGSPIIILQASNGVLVAAQGATITGAIPTPTGVALAYLDRFAGMGVCKVIDLFAQCDPSNDDNVNPGEMLTLAFDTQIDLTSIDFLNAEHSTIWDKGSHAHLSVDGGADQQINLAGSVAVNYTGTNFEFYLHEDQPKNSQFYIRTMEFSSADTQVVPLPAAIWLFGAGIAGLISVTRRKA